MRGPAKAQAAPARWIRVRGPSDGRAAAPSSERGDERPTELDGKGAVARLARRGGSQELRDGRRVDAETLGVLERVAPHVRDDAVARVLDVVEERAPGGHVVDRRREGVDVRARVELDGIEHLLGRDVSGGAGDEASA